MNDVPKITTKEYRSIDAALGGVADSVSRVIHACMIRERSQLSGRTC